MRFCELFVLLARDFEYTKTPRRVVSRCPRLPSGAPDALTHPISSIPRFRGLQLSVRSCSCPQVTCKRTLGYYYLFSRLTHPRISTNFDHRGTPKSRCRPLLSNLREINLERNTSCCDEPLSIHCRSPVKSTNYFGGPQLIGPSIVSKKG